MIFRYARHTKNINKLIWFYTSVLELSVIGNFKNHNGYNGVFLGKENESWHLEFTEDGNAPASQFDNDDFLVFYPQNLIEYQKILDNLKKFDIGILKPKNPYWIENGICFLDPDACSVIISHLKIIS